MADTEARRAEVWTVDFDPVRGHEQRRQRPALVVSADAFNAGAAGLVVVCPITTRERGVRFHVAVDPPEAGLRARSFVLCDQIRTVSVARLTARLGSLGRASMEIVEDRLRILLDL